MLSLEPLSDSGASAKPTVCSADAPDEPDETTYVGSSSELNWIWLVLGCIEPKFCK